MIKRYSGIGTVYLIILLAAWMLGCYACQERKSENPLDTILLSNDPDLQRVMADPGIHEVQIIYTQINRSPDKIEFTDYTFQAKAENYFYPASTVKLPIAVLALEKLNQIDSLSKDTRYYPEGDSIENSFAQDIIKIFTISDNHANNRLFEFLGQDAINNRLHEIGIEPVRIAHRLGYRSESLNTLPLVVYLNDSTTFQTSEIQNQPTEPLEINRLKKGKGYMEDGQLVSQPLDFSLNNYYPLEAQQEVLKRIVFPEIFPQGSRFDLSTDQLQFLREAMELLPRNAGYDPDLYYDSYGKFFMFGDRKDPIPKGFHILNKVGYAYGTLTDCAYIRNDRTGVEFMVTATLLVNENGIFNDDRYEFETVGIPFLAALGREIYTYELSRSR